MPQKSTSKNQNKAPAAAPKPRPHAPKTTTVAAAHPADTQPTGTQLQATQPTITQSDTIQPAIIESAGTQPAVAQPVINQPAATQPAPAAAYPAATQPGPIAANTEIIIQNLQDAWLCLLMIKSTTYSIYVIAELARAQAAIAAAAGAQAAGAGGVPAGSIPRPKSSAGGGRNSFHLREEMDLRELEIQMLKYNVILATIHRCAHAASINLKGGYKHIKPEDLAKVFALSKRLQPYFTRFKNDWATAEILKQYMHSVSRDAKKKLKIATANSGADACGAQSLDDALNGI
ncbi:uncharacterized protein PHACADRAFT_31198 [Phanerochaete carnosa HHB-10118-sp]|uniref:Uncharacterized protein n=1 Tax=Phanerochaete carnosa (strain HHB-10118-sp) TaxID=650164 RepID=K5US54_PHACS|nr:uncharacterized protein PHACADRAFT_31198 [Phanerochaete carnosa HHB-10118-sp]EKM52731.1 hypothetical protein PHACADRAFT_31198 [Phanerochaete carnosa HHB-10118-sp]